MLPTTNLDIVRRMRDGPANGFSEALRAYARSEYNGDGEAVLQGFAQAGRVAPATPKAKPTRGKGHAVARFFAAISARFTRPEGTP